MKFPRALLAGIALAMECSAAPVPIVPADFRNAQQPQLAVAPDGSIHVVFGKDGAIYHSRSRDGRAFSTPVKIAALEKLALGKRRGPRVTATNDLICVAAVSHTDGQLHSWLSADGGVSWRAGSDLNTVAASAREGLHALAGDGRGTVAAAWLDLRNGRMELWSRVSRDGGRSWPPEVLAYAAPDGPICQCCHPSLAFGPGGAIAALWRNSLAGARDMWMAVSTDGGRTFPDPRKLGTGTWKLPACPMDGGSLAYDATGQPITTWRREGTVFLTVGSDAERAISAEAAQPVIASGRGEPWVVWEEKGGLKMQRGTESPVVLTPQGRAPVLATLPDGRVIAAWENAAPRGPALFSEILP